MSSYRQAVTVLVFKIALLVNDVQKIHYMNVSSYFCEDRVGNLKVLFTN